jgi:predicted phage baseplate assembly protein
MPLPTPKLDDRTFADLMADAIKVIDRSCPEWTDRNPSDPGITLLETFAYLTDTMLYRLNRVPEKLYVSLLNLVGAQIRPPGRGGGDPDLHAHRPAMRGSPSPPARASPPATAR